MSLKFTTYDLITGKLHQMIEAPDLDTVALNIPAGQAPLSGHHEPGRFYYDIASKEVVAIPPAPGRWAVFDYTEKAWIDPRTEADLAAELEARRHAAHLAKPAFLMRCMELGLLNPAEAGEASRGEIPEPFQEAFESMTPYEQDELIIIWPSVTQIGRMDDFILKIAQARNIPPELLDLLFGITEDS